MNRYRVTYSANGFSHSASGVYDLTECEASGFSSVAIHEGQFPKGVLCALGGETILSGETSRVFVELLVEADNLAEALMVDPPRDILTRLSDMMTTDIELGGWSLNEIEMDNEARPPAPASLGI